MMLIPVMMLLFVLMLICAIHTCYDADTFTDAYTFTDAETVNDAVNSVPSSSTYVSLVLYLTGRPPSIQSFRIFFSSFFYTFFV